ncbi:MAG: cupin [Cyanobacteria bacterium P01_A01_bin.135]
MPTPTPQTAPQEIIRIDESHEPTNWLVYPDGHWETFGSSDSEEPDRVYRLYHFLSELDNILLATQDDRQRLQQAAPLVRKLLTSSYWLQMEFSPPPDKPGWSVNFLYREYGWPLTAQMVAWLPGNPSPIHNHGAWGIVAIVGGSEKNTIWRRSPTEEHPDRIEQVAELTLIPGDIATFLPGAIHNVDPVGEEMVVSFNLYGKTNFDQRFEFDTEQRTAKRF